MKNKTLVFNITINDVPEDRVDSVRDTIEKCLQKFTVDVVRIEKLDKTM